MSAASHLKSETSTAVRADGGTIFLLGNGPSLKNVRLPDLSDYATIGMNAAYRYWREINWWPTHYACLDLVVGVSHAKAIGEMISSAEELGIEQFLLRDNLIYELGDTALTDRVVNFDFLQRNHSVFSPPAVTTGSHSALWAAHLGYKQIVILGVDGHYKEIVSGASKVDGIELEIVSAEKNPNYFFDDYQQPGDRYCVPNPRPGLHVGAWGAAAAICEEQHCRVFNGNKNSEVRYFDFIDLDSFLTSGAEAEPADQPLPTGEKRSAISQSRPGLIRRVKDFIIDTWKLSLLFILAFFAPALIAALVFGPADNITIIAAALAIASLIPTLLLLFVRHGFFAYFEGMNRQLEHEKVASREMARLLTLLQQKKNDS